MKKKEKQAKNKKKLDFPTCNHVFVCLACRIPACNSRLFCLRLQSGEQSCPENISLTERIISFPDLKRSRSSYRTKRLGFCKLSPQPKLEFLSFVGSLGFWATVTTIKLPGQQKCIQLRIVQQNDGTASQMNMFTGKST